MFHTINLATCIAMCSNLEPESSRKSLEQFEIRVKFLMDIYEITVTKDITVREVKYKIFEKTGIRPDEQILIFEGEYLDDDVTLGWYWIKKNDELDMKFKKKTEAGLFDNEANFKAEQKPLSSDELVEDNSNEKKDKNIDDEQNASANCILDENIFKSTTEDMKIDNSEEDFNKIIDEEKTDDQTEKTVGIVDDNFQITVTDQYGGDMDIEVNRETSILGIKQKISLKTGMKTMDLMLLLEGERLEDTEVVGFYGMKRGSVLQMMAFKVYKSWRIFL